MTVSGLDDPAVLALLPAHEADAWLEEAMLAEEGCKKFDSRRFARGI